MINYRGYRKRVTEMGKIYINTQNENFMLSGGGGILSI